jgi:hypothetical protein
LHVHCAAAGTVRPPLRPIFEPGRVTVQPIVWGFACFQFATLGVVEATIADDAEKNRVCPPIHYWDANRDYLAAFLAALAHDRARADHPVLAAWAKTSRLNPTGGIAAFRDDPRVLEARDRIKNCAAAAAGGLVRLLRE